MDDRPRDVVIEDVAIVTMDAERRILRDAWIAISGNRIDALGEGAPPAGRRTIDGRGGVVMPGMISTHQHVIDALLRGGLEQDRTLFDWLINVYYAGTSAYTPEDCQTAATLNLAEGIASGITTITDNWGVNNGDDPVRVAECAEATLDVYRRTGVRVMFGRMFSDVFPEQWAGLAAALTRKLPAKTLDFDTLVEPVDDALRSIEDLMARHHGSADGRIHVCPAPIMTQIVSPQGLEGAMSLADRFDTIVPIHHCESRTNSRLFTESGPGLSVTDYLSIVGFLGERMLGAHCVWLDDRDIRLLKAHHVKVAHCPSCNMFVASGVAPVPKLVAAGVVVGLGTDDTNTSSNVSMLLEMRHAALLAKVSTLDAAALSAEKVLEMATIDGARAIGLEDDIGSLEPGKKADLVLFDVADKPHWHPRHHLAAVIVYQAQSSDIRTVLVDGRAVLDDGALSFLSPDEAPAFYERAQRASQAIVERAGMDALLARGWQSQSRV
jgi:cytosine/adenosine deaminase-related metal-dependent hydrolase